MLYGRRSDTGGSFNKKALVYTILCYIAFVWLTKRGARGIGYAAKLYFYRVLIHAQQESISLLSGGTEEKRYEWARNKPERKTQIRHLVILSKKVQD